MDTNKLITSKGFFVVLLMLSNFYLCMGQGTENTEADSSHALIMALKSVSGEIPENEFFAITWKVKYSDHLFTIANVDVALSNVGTDSVQSETNKLTEAGVSVYYDLSNRANLPTRIDIQRTFYGGLTGKIFNAEAYFGPTFGSIELKKSKFYSSYFTIGYFRRFYPVNDNNRLVDGKRRADDNLYTEFLIHSPNIDFFKYLTFKGGVLIPLTGSKGSFDDVEFRITVAIPVGNVFTF